MTGINETVALDWVPCEAFGCYVADYDGCLVSHADGDLPADWCEVTAPVPGFLAVVNELLGTDYEASAFAGR